VRYFGLVDCNSFYCSCERVFRPDTRNRPVIVLSNNDGCAIAFSKEAKAVGFGQMCEPYFQLKDRIKQHNVAVFSSNYTLYDNMSKRVMDILRNYTPMLEIYSVDEAFLELDGMEHWDLEQYAHQIRTQVLRQTGIPVGVGIATTKVLSKVANKLAKKSNGVCILKDEAHIDQVLKQFPLKDLWGIGSRSAGKLQMLGIKNAYEFKIYHNDKMIQKLLTKTGRQVQDELRGISCIDMELPEDKKNIGTSRSFGAPVYSKAELREALAEFATHAAEKLRRQQSVCYSLSVYIQTNFFKALPQYSVSGHASFMRGTADTIKIIKSAHQVLDEIYRAGFEYKKAGIILNHVIPRQQNQLDFLKVEAEDNENLGKVMDLINQKFGPHTIKSAACGINQAWQVVARHKSKKYTTCWEELLQVKVKV
jgi:DNA polymerase V